VSQRYCFVTIGWIGTHLERRHFAAIGKFPVHRLRPAWLGQSDAPEQGYSIRDLALDGKHIVEPLHLLRYVLVGHSMGGKVAQFLASQQPPGLAGLVLVAPAPPTPQNIPEPAKQAQLHAYDSRENALQALAFLTAYPPSDSFGSKSSQTISLLPPKQSSLGQRCQRTKIFQE
jgi:pimeloyl-ACP methyl ester carboxylesterase